MTAPPYNFLLPLPRQGRGTTTEQVYAVLRDAIVMRDLMPGAFIDKGVVCERLGVSRFPVSEALGRLGKQGFVEVLPQRGTRVSRIRLDDVRQNLFIRRALEAETVRALAGRTAQPSLDRLDANLNAQGSALASGDNARYYDTDIEFHALLQDLLGYPRVTATIDAARAGLDRVRRMLGSMHRLSVTYAEHEAIVTAIRSGDGDAAAAAMRAHLDAVTAHLEAFAADNPDMFSRD